MYCNSESFVLISYITNYVIDRWPKRVCMSNKITYFGQLATGLAGTCALTRIEALYMLYKYPRTATGQHFTFRNTESTSYWAARQLYKSYKFIRFHCNLILTNLEKYIREKTSRSTDASLWLKGLLCKQHAHSEIPSHQVIIRIRQNKYSYVYSRTNSLTKLREKGFVR